MIWESSSYGDLALVPFKNAPFPHGSRDEGYQASSGFYPREPHYTDSTVGVFVPTHFRPGEQINFVVHFHGHNHNVANVFERYDLRRQMNLTGLNAVLLVPQGPRDAPDSSDGKLQHEEGSLSALLNEALALLAAEGRVQAGAAIGNIALTAHSGGYLVVSAICERKELFDQITDVILFDASYRGLEAFADYGAVLAHRLISICTEHLGFENCKLIALLQKRGAMPSVFLEEDLTDEVVNNRGALIVTTSTLDHDDVVHARDYFAKWMRPCLF